MKKRTLYLSLYEMKIIAPIEVNYPKGVEKIFGAFKTKKQAERWGGEVIELEINQPN